MFKIISKDRKLKDEHKMHLNFGAKLVDKLSITAYISMHNSYEKYTIKLKRIFFYKSKDGNLEQKKYIKGNIVLKYAISH